MCTKNKYVHKRKYILGLTTNHRFQHFNSQLKHCILFRVYRFMRSDHLSKHVKTHNSSGNNNNTNGTKRSGSEEDEDDNSQSEANSANSPASSVTTPPLPPHAMSPAVGLGMTQDIKPQI